MSFPGGHYPKRGTQQNLRKLEAIAAQVGTVNVVNAELMVGGGRV
jgi:hypothetical protein